MFDEFFKELEEWGFNRDLTMERFIDDEQLYIDCLLDFLADTGVNLLEEKIKEEDFVKVFDLGHTIKGVCGNLGLDPIFNTISKLVDLVRKPPYEKDVIKKLDEYLLDIIEQIKTLNSLIIKHKIG